MISHQDIATVLLNTLATYTICVWVNGLFATVAKERDMVRNGGEPLPWSSYLFLGIHYVIQYLLITGITLATNRLVSFTTETGELAVWSIVVFTILVIASSMVLTLIIETLMKTLVIYIVVQRRVKKESSKLKGKIQEDTEYENFPIDEED